MLRRTGTRRSALVALVVVLLAVSDRAGADFTSLDIAWSTRLESLPLTQPVADAQHVYLPLRNGTLRALALADGHEAWTRDISVNAPLATSDGLLACATSDRLLIIRGATGEVHWSAPIGGVKFAPALRGGWVVVASDSDLLAFRVLDGSLVWRIALGSDLRAGAAIDGDRVYAPLADGTLAALDIVSGAIAWRKKLPAAPGAVTPAGGRLYLGAADKFFYALDARDGDRDWRWRTSAEVLAPAAVDDSRVYYTALDNVLRAVDAGSGVQKWRYIMDARPLAGPTLDDGVVIMSGASDLRAVRTTDGTLAGTWRAPGEIADAPIFVPGTSGIGNTRVVVVTGDPTGDWRVYGLAPSAEPMPAPLKEIPGRPLSPDVLPDLLERPTPGGPHPL